MKRELIICRTANMYFKSALCVLISLMMILSGIAAAVPVFAEDENSGSPSELGTDLGVASIGDAQYDSLQAAVDAAQNGDLIILNEDVEETISVSGKKITIDLDGYTLTAAPNGTSSKGEIKTAVLNSNSSELTITNGTISGGRAAGGDPGVIDNRNATLILDNMTVADNEGIAIDNYGKVEIYDSTFKGNFDSKDCSGSMIKLNSSGNTLEANNVAITENNRGWSSLISLSSSSTLTLNDCDIYNNSVGKASVESGSYGTINLNNTTITENTQKHAQYNYSDATGGIKTTGKINFNKSAVYGNKVLSQSKGKDFYISSLSGGEVPLPQDMYDHGEQLKNYSLYSSYDGVELDAPITKSYKGYSSFSVEPGDGDDALCEYNGQTYSSLAKAVAAMNGQPGTVKFLRDAAIGGKFKGHDGLVIDLDGHTITTKASGLSAVNIEGGDITIKNGKFENCKGDNGSAIYVKDANLKVENVEFVGNEGRALYFYHNSPLKAPDTAHYKLTVDGCTFKDNGLNEGAYTPHTVFVVGASADIKDSTFDGNFSAIRVANSLLANEDEASQRQVNIDNCEFTNHKGNVLELYLAAGHDTTITDCVFKDNHIVNKDSDNSSIILFDDIRHYSPNTFSGGDVLMKDCVIEGNSGGDSTIETNCGNKVFENCLIENNEAENAGGIYAHPMSNIELIDTVIRNNHAKGTSDISAGGLVMRAATYISISPAIGGSAGSSENLGYYYSKINMTGGAIYNNSNDNEKGAQDVYITDGKGIENLLSYPEMKDGDKDFENYDAPDRGFVISKRLPISQVFVDPINGDDSNTGDRNAPVKTWVKAVRLLGEYDANSIHVMNTIEIGEDEEDVSVINLGGKYVCRDYEFKGALFDVKDGDISIRNTVISGVSREAEQSAIIVEKDASLTLGEGAKIKENGNIKTVYPEYGGAVLCKGEMTMLDGAVIEKCAAEGGGAICLDGGVLNMEGGLIDGNSAYKAPKPEPDYNIDYARSYGGGVALINGSSMTMNGGTISNNAAYASGGGVATGMYFGTSVNRPSTFTMNGGTIDGNTAVSTGGGVFIQANTTGTINAGTISNNRARSNNAQHAGGGIYVNGVSNKSTAALGIYEVGKLYLKNVEIANNTADWSGGAIAWCGTGRGAVYEASGTVIYDNVSKGYLKPEWQGLATGKDRIIGISIVKDTDIAFYEGTGHWEDKTEEVEEPVLDEDGNPMKDENGKPITKTVSKTCKQWVASTDEPLFESSTSIASKMLNGANYNWTDHNGNAISEDELKDIKHTFFATTKATASDADVQESLALAKVHITGNTSESGGGGIGANGAVYIGYEPPEEGDYEPPEEEEENPEVKTEHVPAPELPNESEVLGVYEDDAEVKAAVKGARTGDDTDIMLLIASLIISASAMTFLVIRRRKV